MDAFHAVIDVGASAVEAMGVLLILCAFLWASVSFVLHAREQVLHRYERYKLALGRALSLGLEFLVAADVIKTVTTAPTFYQYWSSGRRDCDPNFLELVSRGRDGRPLAVAAGAFRRLRSHGLKGER